jgi:hypothetical protein
MDPAKNRFAYTKSLNAKKKTDIVSNISYSVA